MLGSRWLNNSAGRLDGSVELDSLSQMERGSKTDFGSGLNRLICLPCYLHLNVGCMLFGAVAAIGEVKIVRSILDVRLRSTRVFGL